jgi:hypothetical protein
VVVTKPGDIVLDHCVGWLAGWLDASLRRRHPSVLITTVG